MFVSHYVFFLVLSAVGVLLLAWSVRSRSLLFAAACAFVYLSGVAYDNRAVVRQFRIDDRAFNEQHFATLLPVLDALPRATILSDKKTSAFLAGSTHRDVVHSVYLKNALISNEEIAERYCLTQLPLPPEERHIATHAWLVWPDANGAFKDPELRARRPPPPFPPLAHAARGL